MIAVPTAHKEKFIEHARKLDPIFIELGAIRVMECWGDDDRGYEVRHGERRLPTRFPRIDHADMAVRLFQKRRKKQDLSQDYIEER